MRKRRNFSFAVGSKRKAIPVVGSPVIVVSGEAYYPLDNNKQNAMLTAA